MTQPAWPSEKRRENELPSLSSPSPATLLPPFPPFFPARSPTSLSSHAQLSLISLSLYPPQTCSLSLSLLNATYDIPWSSFVGCRFKVPTIWWEPKHAKVGEGGCSLSPQRNLRHSMIQLRRPSIQGTCHTMGTKASRSGGGQLPNRLITIVGGRGPRKGRSWLLSDLPSSSQW